MKQWIATSAASATLCIAATFAVTAFAANDMAGMDMKGGAKSLDAADAANTALTEGIVKKVNPDTGMVTLKHNALENLGMPAMTMAFKAKDAAMLHSIKEGDKVRFRVEKVDGQLTIVKLERQ